MLAGEVSKKRARKVRARDTFKGDTVRGDFQDGTLHPVVKHLSQSTLHLDSLRCSVDGRASLAPEDYLGGAHKTAFFGRIRGSEDRVQRIGGRGLAVSAGDTIHRHALRWIPERGAGERCQGLPSIGNDSHGYAEPWHLAFG